MVGNWKHAQAAATSGIALNPHHSGLYWQRAASLSQMEDLQGAVLDFQRSLSLCGPDDSVARQAWYGLSLAQLGLGQLEAAQESFACGVQSEQRLMGEFGPCDCKAKDVSQLSLAALERRGTLRKGRQVEHCSMGGSSVCIP